MYWNHFFCVQATCEAEIEKILGYLKNSSAGWDDILPQHIKLVKQHIREPLSHICNRSFLTGIFPRELKLANVIPIYKNGVDNLFTNYRPVSILPVFSKVLETLMYRRLLDFINKKKLLYELQFGFREKYSTYMALITMVNTITEALNKGESAIGIFLDFSKAFDTVDHNILLQKLQKYGIRGVSHDWFASYLSNREQYVTYNSVKSSKLKILCGVPQGSILGPLLFLLYINDLSTVSSAALLFMFAVDSSLLYMGKNLNALLDIVNDELDKINEWLKCNKLSINVKKTNYMIFCTPKKMLEDLPIKLNNEAITRIYFTKFLGVFLDAGLTWKYHIEHISKKISKSIGILCKARKLLHKKTLINLYYTFVYPYFTYGIHVWGGIYPTNLQKLVLLQKKIIRIITCSKYLASTENLFKSYNILKFHDIYKYTVGNFVYQFDNKLLPVVFDNFYITNRLIHAHNTRTCGDLCLINTKLNTRQFSIRYAGTKLWNSIPLHIRQSKSLEIFKRYYKTHLMKSLTY